MIDKTGAGKLEVSTGIHSVFSDSLTINYS